MTQTQRPLRLGWLSTGRGPGSRGLLTAAHQAIQHSDLNARIAVVFCSRERGEAEGSDQFLHLAECYGIPTLSLSFRRLRRERRADPAWRLAYDAEMVRLLASHPLDLLVLAGYMLILGEAVWRRYPAVNLHPALPGGPQGTWQEVIWRLMAQGARETGAMVHTATAEVDQGPVVTFCRFPLRGGAFDPLWESIAGVPIERVQEIEGEENALFRRIREEGVKREVPLLLATLRAVAEGRVRIVDGAPVDAWSRPISSYDLTAEIEALLQARGPASIP